MSYVLGAVSAVNTFSNYSLINTPNLFNLFIHILKDLGDDGKRAHFFEEMRLVLGISWFESFKTYLTKKYPHNHHFITLINDSPTEIS